MTAFHLTRRLPPSLVSRHPPYCDAHFLFPAVSRFVCQSVDLPPSSPAALVREVVSCGSLLCPRRSRTVRGHLSTGWALDLPVSPVCSPPSAYHAPHRSPASSLRGPATHQPLCRRRFPASGRSIFGFNALPFARRHGLRRFSACHDPSGYAASKVGAARAQERFRPLRPLGHDAALARAQSPLSVPKALAPPPGTSVLGTFSSAWVGSGYFSVSSSFAGVVRVWIPPIVESCRSR